MAKRSEVEALKEVFVTKDYCNDKKERYVRSDICESRMKNIEEKISDIEQHIGNIETTLNNHMEHMSSDIEQIKIKIAKMGNNSDSKSWFKIITAILGITGGLMTLLYYTIVK